MWIALLMHDFSGNLMGISGFPNFLGPHGMMILQYKIPWIR